MSRITTILRVFIASPNELADERQALDEVVSEINATWSETLGITLETIRWESHAVPGMGRDAQDVVNRSVPQDYDIFIGMLWSRFGTETARADSGTEEEFNIAYQRYKTESQPIEIAFYFKEQALPPGKMDAKQLGKISDFRDRLGEIGNLYWEFDTTQQFKDLVRVHLTRMLQRRTANNQKGTNVSHSEKRSESDEDEGLLDVIVEAEDAMERLTGVAIRIGEATEKLGDLMNRRTSEIRALTEGDASYSARDAKRLIDRSANDLTNFADRTQLDIPVFAEALGTTMSCFAKAAGMIIDLGTANKDDLAQLKDGIGTLRGAVNDSLDGLEGLRSSIDILPRLTGNFNRARKHAVGVLDEMHREFEIGVQNLGELMRYIDEITSNLVRQ